MEFRVRRDTKVRKVHKVLQDLQVLLDLREEHKVLREVKVLQVQVRLELRGLQVL
jgi:hypothetical protein